MGFRPILNSLNLGGIHLQSVFRENEAEVFDGVFGKTTFIWMGVADMFLMIRRVVGINEDVV